MSRHVKGFKNGTPYEFIFGPDGDLLNQRRSRSNRSGRAVLLAIKQGLSCYYCGVIFEGPDLYPTVDHLFPQARGGPIADWNEVAACKACNGDKACLTEDEYKVVIQFRGLSPIERQKLIDQLPEFPL